MAMRVSIVWTATWDNVDVQGYAEKALPLICCNILENRPLPGQHSKADPGSVCICWEWEGRAWVSGPEESAGELAGPLICCVVWARERCVPSWLPVAGKHW